MGEQGSADTDMQLALAQFSAIFREQLPVQLGRAEALLAGLTATPDPQRLGELHRIFHKLAGSAATFGFAALGELAREAEELMDPLLRDGLRDGTRQLAPVAERLARMAALAGPGGAGA